MLPPPPVGLGDAGPRRSRLLPQRLHTLRLYSDTQFRQFTGVILRIPLLCAKGRPALSIPDFDLIQYPDDHDIPAQICLFSKLRRD